MYEYAYKVQSFSGLGLKYYQFIYQGGALCLSHFPVINGLKP